jgi:signal transduction histidine kinase
VVRGAIAAVRDISYGLRPPALDQLGLMLAMENHCAETARRTGIDISFQAVGMDGVSLDFDTEINLYRMVQEALNNTAKHAGATRASVRLVRSHPDLLIRIEDNGRGFDVDRRMSESVMEKRMGLRSMEERARLISGTMEIQAQSGAGTRIIFRIPLETARRST